MYTVACTQQRARDQDRASLGERKNHRMRPDHGPTHGSVYTVPCTRSYVYIWVVGWVGLGDVAPVISGGVLSPEPTHPSGVHSPASAAGGAGWHELPTFVSQM